ncbi:MAG: phosphotransferase [Bifidobacteriaceae bacterium]|nr:phosphotransferase [Bifidobacteriaceae bacterium]
MAHQEGYVGDVMGRPAERTAATIAKRTADRPAVTMAERPAVTIAERPAERTAEAITAAATLLAVPPALIRGLEPLAGGSTNDLFVFRCAGRAYVLRLVGAGAGSLANRAAERAAYEALRAWDITDELVALDSAGRRITVFHEGARTADPLDDADLAVALKLARRLHTVPLAPGPRFGLGAQVRRYERLAARSGLPAYPDLARRQAQTAELLAFLDGLGTPEVCCHGDLTCDNVLILPDGRAKLIDWEYAGWADPMLDVASYCLYSFFGRDRVGRALRLYLNREPAPKETARLYAHLAVASYGWALWAQCCIAAGAPATGDLSAYGGRTYAYGSAYAALI